MASSERARRGGAAVSSMSSIREPCVVLVRRPSYRRRKRTLLQSYETFSQCQRTDRADRGQAHDQQPPPDGGRTWGLAPPEGKPTTGRTIPPNVGNLGN